MRTQKKVKKTDAEWRTDLSDESYRVTRERGTERPFENAYHDLKTPAVYHCICCGTPLFDSDHKFDSGTGWPSFSKEIDGAVGTRKDRKFFMIRTECHCSNCGSHLGHIFDDGPQPTGKRHCINGVSLVFHKA